MPTLADIEALVRAYSTAHAKLADEVRALDEEIAAAKRRRMTKLRRLVDGASTARTALADAVGAAPDLFERPRTHTMHGVKFGYAKGKGRLEFPDAGRVCDLIRKHFPDREDELVAVTEAPVKAALNRMSVAELRRIGVTVVEADDQVVVKTTDTEIDKMVDALLRDATDVETAA